MKMIVPNKKIDDKYADIDPFEWYKIDKNFDIKRIYCLDIYFLHVYFPVLYRRICSVSYSLSLMLYLMFAKKNTLYIRDEAVLKVITALPDYFLKRLGMIFYESHSFSDKAANCCRFVNGVIPINEYQKRLYSRAGISNKKIFTAHDGVNICEYQDIVPATGKNKNILYFGSLSKWKGVETLIDSMRYLEGYFLRIIGGPESRLNELKKYVESESIGGIEFIKYVHRTELFKYITQAQVLVLPNSKKDVMSLYTSPLKMFEYMASRRVIVASRLDSVQEILLDGENSILFEPDNPNDLAKKIIFAFSNDNANLIQCAYSTVQKYSWLNRAENIKKFIFNIGK